MILTFRLLNLKASPLIKITFIVSGYLVVAIGCVSVIHPVQCVDVYALQSRTSIKFDNPSRIYHQYRIQFLSNSKYIVKTFQFLILPNSIH